MKKVKNAFIKELGNHDGVELSKELKQKLNLKFDIKVKKTFINIGRNENQNAFDFIKENSEEYTKSNAFNILHENITTYKASLNTRTLSNITIEPCEVSKDMQENREDDKFKIHELVNDLLWIQKAIKDRKKVILIIRIE